MENYNEFLDRINSFEKESFMINDIFIPSKSVSRKVKPDNTYSDFYGDTVVFELDENIKERIDKLTEKLFEEVPECFSERLPKNTYHITLHDLYNSSDLDKVADKTFLSEIQLIKLLNEFPVESQKIKMRTNYIINMVNTSVVLAFIPCNETEFTKLSCLYELIQKIRKLDRPLTPHVTLGYYNINGFSENSVKKLKSTVQKLNNGFIDFEIELSTEKLFYQKFISMKEYINIFSLNCNSFCVRNEKMAEKCLTSEKKEL